MKCAGEGEDEAAGRVGDGRRTLATDSRTGGRGSYLRRRRLGFSREEDEASVAPLFSGSYVSGSLNIEPISRAGARDWAGTLFASAGVSRYRARKPRPNVEHIQIAGIRDIRARSSRRISNIKPQSKHPNDASMIFVTHTAAARRNFRNCRHFNARCVRKSIPRNALGIKLGV